KSLLSRLSRKPLSSNPTRTMASSGLTDAQREILRKLPDSVETARLDRIWIFDPHIVGPRESGLFVVSLVSESRLGGEMRELITSRCTFDQQGSAPVFETVVLPEGWAPPDRLDRIIAGVLSRSGDQAGDPREETLEPGEEWDALLCRLDLPA